MDFVKINDKRLAKQYGITKFPALTYFREKEPIIYEGQTVTKVLRFLMLNYNKLSTYKASETLDETTEEEGFLFLLK